MSSSAGGTARAKAQQCGCCSPTSEDSPQTAKAQSVFRREVWPGAEIWTSIQKTVATAGPRKRGYSTGFRHGPQGHMILSKGSRGEEEPPGDEERAGKTSAHADHPSPGSSKVFWGSAGSQDSPGRYITAHSGIPLPQQCLPLLPECGTEATSFEQSNSKI